MAPHNRKGRSIPSENDRENWNAIVGENARKREQEEVVVSECEVKIEVEPDEHDVFEGLEADEPSIFDDPTLEDLGLHDDDDAVPEPLILPPADVVEGEPAELPSLAWLQQTFKTKSAVIRYLLERGHKVKEISKHLGIRYQHVRNVMKTPLKRGPNEAYKVVYVQAQVPATATTSTTEDGED